MDIRPLTDSYAVSPQIALDDFPAIRAAGYVTVIDNRPDGEIPADLHTARMRAAAEAAGLRFVANPIIGGAMTMANVEAQKVAMAESSGPVFAYCASGNRSSQVWALAHAGTRPTDELISIPARFGYQLEGLRGQIDMLATRG
ncbi:MAG: TIGR01244 family phosphatase [Cereibacter sphaeroides]|uniref:TIGR01244 family phosphatase n=1 Tax=Cereibacter sphaeroides TaxID=1063 RepID=A0A2W5S286_CERSP|nr:MAG: TIGR01244 family phosphatase [Cereibacter sphaeroides]